MGKWYNNRCEDGVWYSEKFDSREDAITDGVWQYKEALKGESTDLFDDADEIVPPSGLFYIAESDQYVPEIDAVHIIERLQEDADCQCGEAAEDFLDWDYLDDGWVDELQDGLQKELDTWLERHDLMPTFSSLKNVEEIDAEDYM